MTNVEENEIIRTHIKLDETIEKALASGDYRTNNRAAKSLNSLFREISNNRELAGRVYIRLLSEPGIRTKAHAASECLRLGIYTHEAEKILTELAQRKDIGITSLSAEYTLKVWRGEIPGKHL